MLSANQIAGFFKMQYLKKEVNDEVYFWHVDKHQNLLQVDKLSFWVCTTRHAQSTQFKKFAYLCKISRKTWGMKLNFHLQINVKVFHKMIVSQWVWVARHTQNNKCAISLQYVKENIKDEVDFLPVDKCKKVSSD